MISPRPWKISDDDDGRFIIDANGDAVCDLFYFHMPNNKDNTAAIIDAVNGHPPWHSLPGGLSSFTDEEIAAEHRWRMMKKLGDPRTCVSMPVAK